MRTYMSLSCLEEEQILLIERLFHLNCLSLHVWYKFEHPEVCTHFSLIKFTIFLVKYHFFHFYPYFAVDIFCCTHFCATNFIHNLKKNVNDSVYAEDSLKSSVLGNDFLPTATTLRNQLMPYKMLKSLESLAHSGVPMSPLGHARLTSIGPFLIDGIARLWLLIYTELLLK